MKKKLMMCLLAVALAFVLAACGGSPAQSGSGTTGDASAEADASAGYMVYLVTMDQMDMHWVAVDEGCRDAISELAGDITIDYRWDAPTDGKNDVGQMEIINNAVANGADLILMASNGPDTQVATIKEAADKGVKFIYVDSPANFDAYQILATDNVAAGTTAGNAMIEALKAEGVESGDIGVVNVNPATASTMMRETGFRAAFEGTDYNVLESQYGEGQVAMSQEIAVNLITQGVVGIFGTNEGGTTGVGNAIAESSRKVIGVGFDKSDAILEHIRSGNLLCTMAQNPYVMGYEGIKSAVKVLKGEALDAAVLDTGVSVVDASTVDN